MNCNLSISGPDVSIGMLETHEGPCQFPYCKQPKNTPNRVCGCVFFVYECRLKLVFVGCFHVGWARGTHMLEDMH